MEESGKKRLVTWVVALSGFAYFFIFAAPLPKELRLTPIWASLIPENGSLQASAISNLDDGDKDGSSLLPFKVGGEYGYFSSESGVRSFSRIGFDVALADSSYVAYERLPTELSIKSPAGVELARSKEPGYPFYSAGRLFVLGPGQLSVTEIGLDGTTLWRRDFSSTITAFDASERLAVFGFLDGGLVGVGKEGEKIFSFSPGGSRLACVYGCAVSADGLTVASVTGIDRQRLVVLEKRSSDYRVTYHRYLESEFRRSVLMAFSPDGRYLLYEQGAGAGIYDVRNRRESFLPAFDVSGLGAYQNSREILAFLEGGAEPRLLLALSGGARIIGAQFSAVEASLRIFGDSIFVGLGDKDGESAILRLDAGEF